MEMFFFSLSLVFNKSFISHRNVIARPSIRDLSDRSNLSLASLARTMICPYKSTYTKYPPWRNGSMTLMRTRSREREKKTLFNIILSAVHVYSAKRKNDLCDKNDAAGTITHTVTRVINFQSDALFGESNTKRRKPR